MENRPFLNEEELAEYRKNMDARNVAQNALNSKDRVTDPYKGFEKTLAIVIATFELFIMGGVARCTKKGVPLLESDPLQQKHWDNQVVQGRERTCLIRMQNGDIRTSPSCHYMYSVGTTSATNAERAVVRGAAVSAQTMGHDQNHSVEGTSIHLFKKALNRHCPVVASQWTFEPVFDGLQADMMGHHSSWDNNQYIAIQIKSANIQLGTQANYHLKRGQYEPWMYCIALGMRGYTMNENPTSPDDASAPGASLFEIWNIGSTENIRTSMSSLPTKPFIGVSDSRRLWMTAKSPEVFITDFLLNMLEEMQNWPTLFTREQILYDFDVLNKVHSKTCKTEKEGFQVLDKAIAPFGLRFLPVARQNEAVDGKIVGGDLTIYVSNKTASIHHNNNLQRGFKLGKAPNKQFCTVVIASYAGNLQRVAVMAPDLVYTSKMHFNWNEKDLKKKPGVRIFDLDTQSKDFVEHLKNQAHRVPG